jgi:hypothetical protein
MKIFLMALSQLIFFLVCIGTVPETLVPTKDNHFLQQGSYLRWTASDLVGYTYKLIDDGVEEYRFSENGTVALTTGPRGGPYAGPLLYWVIDTKGLLNIGRHPGVKDFSWVKLEETENRILVYSKNQKKTFIRSKDVIFK